jgi:hypothetical protein
MPKKQRWSIRATSWVNRERQPMVPDIAEGAPWPLPHKEDDPVVLIQDGEYQVSVEFTRDSEGKPVPTGLRVQKAVPMDPQPELEPQGDVYMFAAERVAPRWSKEPEAVSAREIRRLPLTAYVEAAVAYVSSGGRFEALERLREIHLPRGLPERGRSAGFYREIADAYRQLRAQGKRPVPEIARRKRVDENTVHQWVYRARQLGFLEKPLSGRKKQR